MVVVGEADLNTAGQLGARLIDALGAEPTSLVVELGALDFCDLSGLDALHDAARTASEAGVSLTFRGMSPQLAWLHATFPPRNARPGPVPLLASVPDAGTSGPPEAPTSPDLGCPARIPPLAARSPRS